MYGIKALELNGRTPLNKRKSVLEEFRASTREAGSRVLILSMVGMVGLNLACANVMIIAVSASLHFFTLNLKSQISCIDSVQDTLWSALDDEQLRGRIYRYPQQKTVQFYRLVARGTPDVFLNNIAFDKGMLHQAFVGIDSHSRKFTLITPYHIHKVTPLSLVQLFMGNTDDSDPTIVIESDKEEDEVMEIDPPSEPKVRNKRGTKKAQNQAAQAPLSPTRPAMKRGATPTPTSPTRTTRPQPKRFRAKEGTGKGKEKEKKKKTETEPIPQTTVSAAGPSDSASMTVTPAAPTITATAHTTTIAAPTTTTFVPATPTSAPAAPPPVPTTPVGATRAEHDVIMANPTGDPILDAMLTDPDYQKDPDELEEMAAAMLNFETPSHGTTRPGHSSPLPSLPPSPTPMCNPISTGIKTRSNAITSSSSVAPETISGVALVPGGKGMFKRGARTAGATGKASKSRASKKQ